jgi:predicted phage terminase large subunit-like protein
MVTDMTRSEQIAKLRKIKIAKAKRNFWEFAKLTDGDYFHEEHSHLRILSEVLQAYVENRIVRSVDGSWEIVTDTDSSREVCNMLFISMPPRHGKTRTLTNFIAWVLGNKNSAKFLYTSYNDSTASDTSRYIRDTIQRKSTSPASVVYHDIFTAKLQNDNKAVQKWALEGQYFNLIAAGREGSVTGKGCDMLVIDDPVKSARDAMSEVESEATWDWFRGTLLSRVEEGGKLLINHTRWPRKDLIERLKTRYAGKKNKPYYELVMKAHLGEQHMLCPDLLTYYRYEQMSELMDDAIFLANYQQEVTDMHGQLYKKFSTYYVTPTEFEERRGYCDSADKGDNYLCSIVGKYSNGYLFVEDVVYTQERVEHTEQMVVNQLLLYEVDYYKVESNNGGRGFALAIEDMVSKAGGRTYIDWEVSSSNKETRIITNSGMVQTRLLFPKDWKERWPVFYEHLSGYMRTGKNKFDDAPDCATMAVIDLDAGGLVIYG